MLKQVDTYFNAKSGRVKLREINGKGFELIYYKRADRQGSRYSDYVIVPLKEPKTMKSLCTALFGVETVVEKRRTLFLYKNARIHLDNVRTLGLFVEFEVLVNRGKRQAKQLMQFLVSEFGFDSGSSIAGSYVDLLLKR